MTLLFAPCYLDEGLRLDRNLKWLHYYTKLKNNLVYEDILLVDNGSSKTNQLALKLQYPKTIILKNDIHLKRLINHAYGYWYRAFAQGIKYAKDNGYSKLLHIDSDVFILNQKMVDWCNNTSSGWVSQYCKMYNYPESTFQIINSDQFDKAYKWFSEDFLEFYPYDIAETRIPFTHIEKSFNGDRFGEKGIKQLPEHEWFGQCPVETEMKFNG